MVSRFSSSSSLASQTLFPPCWWAWPAALPATPTDTGGKGLALPATPTNTGKKGLARETNNTAATVGDHADFRPLTFYRSDIYFCKFVNACASSDSGVEGGRSKMK